MNIGQTLIFGGLLVAAGTLAETVDDAPQLVSGWNAEAPGHGVDAETNEDKITILTAGWYALDFQASVAQSDLQDLNAQFYRIRAGTAAAIQGSGCQLEATAAIEARNMSMIGFAYCEVDDQLCIYWSDDGDNDKNATIEEGQFLISYLGRGA